MSINRRMDKEDMEYICIYMRRDMCIYSFGIMDFSRCIYMCMCIYGTHIDVHHMCMCVYIYTHIHTQWNIYSVIKRNKICVISRDVDGLETLIQSKVSQNEERFSDRENRWQAK